MGLYPARTNQRAHSPEQNPPKLLFIFRLNSLGEVGFHDWPQDVTVHLDHVQGHQLIEDLLRLVGEALLGQLVQEMKHLLLLSVCSNIVVFHLLNKSQSLWGDKTQDTVSSFRAACMMGCSIPMGENISILIREELLGY